MLTDTLPHFKLEVQLKLYKYSKYISLFKHVKVLILDYYNIYLS